MDFNKNTIRVGTVSSGLIAGLLYGWTVSVIPGLRRLPDATYIATMQSINRAIITPAFIVPFMGLPIGLTAGAIARFRRGDTRQGWLMAGAAATYTAGVLGVTIGRNVPLNNALEFFDPPSASETEIAACRQSYESSWNRWHNLRTAASVASFALAAAAATSGTD